MTVELVKFQVTDTSDERTVAEKWAPNLYNSTPSRLVIRCVKHVVFRYLFDLIILLNAICLAFDWASGEWWFLALFMLEIILKLYSFGTRAFFRKLWNIFDVVIVGSAFVVSVITIASDDLKESVIALDTILGRSLEFITSVVQQIIRRLAFFSVEGNTCLQNFPIHSKVQNSCQHHDSHSSEVRQTFI